MDSSIKLDAYGFPTKMNDASIEFYNSNVVPFHETTDSIWFEYIKSINGSQNIDIKSKHFKKLVRSGIPDKQRACIWCKILGVFDKMTQINVEKDFYYDTLRNITEETFKSNPEAIEQILLDVPRTFSGATCFSSGSVLNILKVFAVLHPEIGYCQSLNFIAAIIVSVIQDEEPSFWAFEILVTQYFPSEYFVPSMFDLSVDLCMTKMLLEERTPEIMKKTNSIGYDWIISVSGYLLTIFSNSFPIPTVLRIWDSFILEGPKIVFRVIIAFLRLNEEEILKCNDSNTLSDLMRNSEANMVDQEKLMKSAFSIKLFSRSHLTEMRKTAKENVQNNGLANHVKIKTCLQSLYGKFGH